METEVISVRIPRKMKQALEYAAEGQYIPLSSALKQAIALYLKHHEIDWEKNDFEKIRKAVEILKKETPTFLDVLKKEFPNLRFEMSDDADDG